MHGKKTLSIILVISMFVTALIIPSSVSATETSSITIHYFNGNNFKEPYVYYYSNNNQPVTWPGSAMKAEGNNWYSYIISNMSEAKIILVITVRINILHKMRKDYLFLVKNGIKMEHFIIKILIHQKLQFIIII